MKTTMPGCVCVFIFCATGARAETPALSCPAGTEARIEPIEGNTSRQQACVDPKTGMKEGPAMVLEESGKVSLEFGYLHDRMHGKSRVFDPAGELMVEMDFDQGEQKSGRVTASGLRTMLGNLQTRASMYSMTAEVSIPQDWTIRYDVSGHSEETRKMACEIFTSPFDNDFVVQVREVGAEGKVIREEKLTRKDCAQPP